MISMGFYKWVHLNFRKASLIVGLLSLTPIITYVSKYFKEVNSHGFGNLISFSLNTMLIALLLAIFLAVTPRINNDKYRSASIKVMNFNYTWIAFLFAFFLMYLYFTIIEAGLVFKFIEIGDPIISAPTNIIIEYVFSETTILALFFCYIRIAGYRLAPILFPSFMVWALCILSYLIAFLVLGSSNADRLNLAISIMTSGINCTIFALFIGRIESKVIATPLAIISALYFYAALQAFTGPIDWAVNFFRSSTIGEPSLLPFLEQIREILTIIGAFLKGLLSLVVYWLLDTGILLFYFEWVVNQSHSLDNDRDAFLFSLQL